MFHLIYRTSNLLNGKIYIGYHRTPNLEDEYLGSGKILKESIKKYGVSNFKKEILYIFNNSTEAFLKERELVDLNFILRKDTYNIKLGGSGGWDHTWKDPKRIAGIRKAAKEGKLNPTKNGNHFQFGFLGKTHSLKNKKIIGNFHKLSNLEFEKRVNEYNSILKNRGWIGILAKSWNISHTQVRRFINKIS